jgi:hypothetical protein
VKSRSQTLGLPATCRHFNRRFEQAPSCAGRSNRAHQIDGALQHQDPGREEPRPDCIYTQFSTQHKQGSHPQLAKRMCVFQARGVMVNCGNHDERRKTLFDDPKPGRELQAGIMLRIGVNNRDYKPRRFLGHSQELVPALDGANLEFGAAGLPHLLAKHPIIVEEQNDWSFGPHDESKEQDEFIIPSVRLALPDSGIVQQNRWPRQALLSSEWLETRVERRLTRCRLRALTVYNWKSLRAAGAQRSQRQGKVWTVRYQGTRTSARKEITVSEEPACRAWRGRE